MYFVVATLADVDPMYQFSLKYFNQVYKQNNLNNLYYTICIVAIQFMY